MESLAALVAGIFIAVISFSILNIVLAILYRRGKVKHWIPSVANAVTGIIALWGIATVWVMGVAPSVSVLISSILITWPRKNRAK
jgi:hypothetical protein